MGQEILVSFRRARPRGVLKERLATQLIRDAQALERAQARDAIAPVCVLGLAGSEPVTGDELTNAARDHSSLYRGPVRGSDPLGGATRYTQWEVSERSCLTDARGKTTRLDYDERDRLRTTSHPARGEERLTDNDAARLATRTDRRGVITSFE